MEIETQRLLLRMPREQDLDAFAALAGDAEGTRFVGGPVDRMGAWQKMASQAGHWALRGYGKFVVEEKDTGQLIGRVGPAMPEGWPAIELGWQIARDRWGRGYATEAAAACLPYIFETLRLDEIISLIHPENTASIRVAERLGQTPKGGCTLLGEDLVIYALGRTSWAPEKKHLSLEGRGRRASAG